MKLPLRIICSLFIFFAFVLVTAEGLLRLSQNFLENEKTAKIEAFRQKTFSRLYRYWTKTDGTAAFLPPYLVYSNRDSGDETRLKKIFETTKLQPSRTWKSYDFIQDEIYKEETAYSAHSNSVGFRGPEYQKVKPPGVKRVIALGSYQTFGHGLEDGETYPAQLEKILNATPGPKGRFEVWNGGRHAGTAIAGLARMKHEIFNYNPDLLILEYGFVDTAVWGDGGIPLVSRPPESKSRSMLRKLFRPFVSLTSNSRLWKKIADKNTKSLKGSHLVHLRESMSAMVRLAAKNGVPVILMKSFGSEPGIMEIFRGLQSNQVVALDILELFIQHPPNAMNYREFNPEKSWLREVDPSIREETSAFGFAPYRLDFLQLSARGQQALAQSIAPEVFHLLQLK